MSDLRVHDLPVDDPGWASALPVLQELRPHLTDDLRRQVLRESEAQALRFLGAFDGDACLGVIGWRVVVNTSAIRKASVDDLVTTDSARSRGVGKALLDAVATRAREAGCRLLDLDSGVQRHDAHRFYLRERMHIRSHHFSKPL